MATSEIMNLAADALAENDLDALVQRSSIKSGETIFEVTRTPFGAVRLGIAGDTALITALQELQTKTVNAIGRDVLSEANEIVNQEILSRVPVRTGKLKAGIGKTAGKRSRNRISNVVYMPLRKDLGIDAKDPYYYPAALEFGRRARRPTSKRRRSRVRDLLDKKVWEGKPFMRPGYDAAEPHVIAFIQKHLPERIIRAWQSGVGSSAASEAAKLRRKMEAMEIRQSNATQFAGRRARIELSP